MAGFGGLAFGSLVAGGHDTAGGRRVVVKKSRARVLLGPGGEFDFIRELLGAEAPLSSGILVGPGDDCAVLANGCVLSSDLMIEGIHFQRTWITLEELGWRAAAAALSDVAAMGARPLGILLSMSFSEVDADSGPIEVQRGARDLCDQEGIQVLGGDLARSPGPVILDVMAVGETDEPVLRAGGMPGDELWVTGRLGGSALAVSLWKGGQVPVDEVREAFARPRARLRESQWLVNHSLLRAMVDLSDGLAGDAGHLAAASGVSVVLEAGSIPVHRGFDGGILSNEDALHMALTGGEDYELLCAVAPGSLDRGRDGFVERFGIPLTRIGSLSEGEGVFLATSDGKPRPLERGGFSHFQGRTNG